jgi:3-methyladenine DNA glycosylase/8-oxoguanine DNA glycosylase
LFPLGDVAVVNTIKELDIHEKEAMRAYKKMESHRSMATFIVALLPQKKEIGQ